MKDFLFHKRGDAQPTPVVPETTETPETPVTPETLAAPEVPDVPETPEIPEEPEAPEISEEPEASREEEISTAYLLEQLEAIRKDSAHIREAMDKISLMERGEETKICAIREIAVSRETTNQQLIATYSGLLPRKGFIKAPNLDSLGRKWSDLGDKVKKSVELTPEQDAELKRQIDQATQDLQDASEELKKFAKHGGESVQHYVSEAFDAIRQATRGKVDIRVGTRGRSTAPKEEKEYSGSTLDMVTALLRDPSFSMEEKELILDHAEELRDLEESLQAKVLELLGDPTLSAEEKELIFDHIEDIREVEETVQAKVLEILGDVTLSVAEKELILDHLEELQELS